MTRTSYAASGILPLGAKKEKEKKNPESCTLLRKNCQEKSIHLMIPEAA